MDIFEKNTLISFQNVGLAFPNTLPLFHGLTLHIPENAFCFLTGCSGSGKSTFLKMIYLDQKESSGKIFVFGKHTRSLSSNQASLLRRQVGVVFQDFRLIPHLTLLENVALPLKIRGVHTKKRAQDAKELLDWVGLSEHFHHYPSTLSGGQQQRAAIVRAVIGKPKILLADEPTGNVDDEAALRLLHLFEELHKLGTTIVLATHNRALAESFTYPELILKNGSISLVEKV